MIWRYGGAWERFFLAWPWIGFAGYFGLMTWTAVWVRPGPQDFERVGVICISYLVTIYPAAWAQESSATLKGLKEAGLEPANLSDLKIEYLERYGERGINPAARAWAGGFIIVYLAWTAFALAASKTLWPSASLFIGVQVVLVVGLVAMFAVRLRAFYNLAGSRGYHIYELALDLRKRGLRR